MDLYGHLFEGSDKESAERMQKLFGNRPAPLRASSDVIVIRPPQRKKARPLPSSCPLPQTLFVMSANMASRSTRFKRV
jgi:hypothetical protein